MTSERSRLTATCGTSSKFVNIKVIVPEPNSVGFLDYSSNNEHDIYEVNDPVWTRVNSPDDPASYTMNTKIKIQADFWGSNDLSYPTVVDINVYDPEITTFTVASNVTFSDSWPSGNSNYVSVNSLQNEIGIVELGPYWQYRVPSGTNDWISMGFTGAHGIYVVFDGPKGDAASNYTKENLIQVFSCITEDGLNEEAEIASFLNDQVYDEIHTGCICDDGFQVNFDAAMGNPPTSGNKGMCCCRAEGLNCVLQILGIGPYVHDYVNQHSESNYDKYFPEDNCAICGDCEWCYWAGEPMRWQGVIKSGGNGSTCYSPNAVGGRDEGTYAEFQSTIESHYNYAWFHSPWGENDICEHLDDPNIP